MNLDNRKPMLVYAGLFAVFLMHSIGTILFFEHPGDLLRDVTILNDDYPPFYYQILTDRLVYTNLQTWAYDPSSMAGYPHSLLGLGITWMIVSKVLFFLNSGAAMKVGLLLMVLPVPFLFYIASRYTGLGRGYSFCSAVVGVIVYRTGLASFGNWVGMSAAVFSAVMCVVAISALVACFNPKAAPRHYFGLFLWLTLATLAHPTSAIVLFMPFTLAFILLFRKAGARRTGFTIVTIVCSFIINLWWLLPMYYLRRYSVPQDTGVLFQPEGISPLKQLFDDLLGFWQGGAGTILALDASILLALAGIFRMRSQKGSSHAFIWLSGILFLGIITYAGGSIELLRAIQPRRYLLPLSIMLVPLSGWGVAWVHSWAKAREFKPLVLNLALIAIAVGSLTLNNFSHLFSITPWRTRLTYPLPELVSYLKNEVKGEGRLMAEDSSAFGPDGENHVYNGGHFLVLMPQIINRELIGGPHPGYLMINRFASLEDGKLAHKPISSLSKTQIRDYMDLYNITWALVWSRPAKNALDSFPELFQKVHEIDIFRIYRLKRDSNFFIGATGDIKAEQNRIEVKSLAPTTSEAVILKYHWLETFRSQPDVGVEPVKLMDDPVPFIKITNPVPNFVIYNSYEFNK